MKKIPLLTLLLSRYPDIGKKELFARIVCGEVLVAGEKIKSPEHLCLSSDPVEFTGKPFVSRGGEKLEYAAEFWNLEISGNVFLDAGSSTGGFTHCLLLRGAEHVHAVDVGYNQLEYALRTDSRVSVHERTNIMDIFELDPQPDAAVADLSFRSLVPAASHILRLVRENWLIGLIKPQFEWENPDESFDGVIRSNDIVESVVLKVLDNFWAAQAYPFDIIESPVPGRKGNREYLVYVKSKIEREKEQILQNASRIIHEGF